MTIVDANHLWTETTVVKHPIEMEYIREALSIVEIGLYASFAAVAPGARERDVAVAAETAMRQAGSEMQPFMTVISSGRNTGIFERIATEKIADRGYGRVRAQVLHRPPAGLGPARRAADQQGRGLRAATRHGDVRRTPSHALRPARDRRRPPRGVGTGHRDRHELLSRCRFEDALLN